MNQKIKFDDDVIRYRITRTNRKTSAIVVTANDVVVKTSLTKGDNDIKRMVLSKRKWIIQKQVEFNYKTSMQTETPVTDKYLENRAQKLAIKMGMRPPQILIKNMKTRWGSTSKFGVITLNNVIVNAPLKVIDYVIIHELCHLKIRDHSKRFWNLLSQYDVHFRENKKWLELHAGLLLNIGTIGESF